jgi:sRNA-binding carbon storage regulator CsrA
MALVLTRRAGEHIVLSTEFEGRMVTLAVITYIGHAGDRGRIAVSGAPSIRVSRSEVFFNDIKELDYECGIGRAGGSCGSDGQGGGSSSSLSPDSAEHDDGSKGQEIYQSGGVAGIGCG